MTDFDRYKEACRHSYEELRQALESCTPPAVFKSHTSCTCPFHGDSNPSASINDKGGHWKYTCFVPSCGFAGDVFDVQAARDGVKVEDLLARLAKEYMTHRPPTPKPSPPPKAPTVHPDLESLKRAALFATQKRGSIEIEDAYYYVDPGRWTPEMQSEEDKAKVSDLIVLRVKLQKADGTPDKTLVQGHPVPGGFILKKPEGSTPLYNRIAVRGARSVLVVEGEKCVKVAQKVVGGTMAVTTGSGGSNNAENIDWSPLAGKAAVYLWEDNDPVDEKTGLRAGEQYMKTVVRKLQELNPPPACIYRVDPEIVGLDDNGADVVDYLDLYGGDTDQSKRDVLAEALKHAKPFDAAAELDRLIEEEIAGLHRTISFPWASVARLAKPLRPATVTMLCGDGGSGKSLWILEAAWWWYRNGVKIAIYELEEDRTYHLKRVLAQLAEESGLTDPEWVESHPDDARGHLSIHRSTIAGLTPCIDDAPDVQLTYRQVLEWIERRAAAGCRVIVVDPITAVATSDKPWVEDLAFLMAAKTIARKYRCSLILVTHPRKGRKSSSSSGMDDMAGGAAFPRFCQTMLWMIRPDSPKRVRCTGVGETSFNTTVNRILRIPKARNGPGAGLEIGFNFEAQSLRFGEQGVIEDEVEAAVQAAETEPDPIPWRSATPNTPQAPQQLDFDV